MLWIVCEMFKNIRIVFRLRCCRWKCCLHGCKVSIFNSIGVSKSCWFFSSFHIRSFEYPFLLQQIRSLVQFLYLFAPFMFDADKKVLSACLSFAHHTQTHTISQLTTLLSCRLALHHWWTTNKKKTNSTVSATKTEASGKRRKLIVLSGLRPPDVDAWTTYKTETKKNGYNVLSSKGNFFFQKKNLQAYIKLSTFQNIVTVYLSRFVVGLTHQLFPLVDLFQFQPTLRGRRNERKQKKNGVGYLQLDVSFR